jgi:hypothetical protein
MDRRRTTRREPCAGEPLSRVRFRAGREVTVVNVSNTGLLVESAARLLPGTHVDVHVVTKDGRVLVRSRVTRAYVSSLTADVICYRGALAFDRIVDTSAIGYAIPDALMAVTEPEGIDYPMLASRHTVDLEDRLSA